jgi:hypothetical protein
MNSLSHFSQVLWVSGNWDTYSCCIAAFIYASVWDACKGLTLINLMIATVVSLALGITTPVLTVICLAKRFVLFYLLLLSINTTSPVYPASITEPVFTSCDSDAKMASHFLFFF